MVGLIKKFNQYPHQLQQCHILVKMFNQYPHQLQQCHILVSFICPSLEKLISLETVDKFREGLMLIRYQVLRY